jgi:hypothetical protein
MDRNCEKTRFLQKILGLAARQPQSHLVSTLSESRTGGVKFYVFLRLPRFAFGWSAWENSQGFYLGDNLQIALC